jgi:hypothetical protein
MQEATQVLWKLRRAQGKLQKPSFTQKTPDENDIDAMDSTSNRIHARKWLNTIVKLSQALCRLCSMNNICHFLTTYGDMLFIDFSFK